MEQTTLSAIKPPKINLCFLQLTRIHAWRHFTQLDLEYAYKFRMYQVGFTFQLLMQILANTRKCARSRRHWNRLVKNLCEIQKFHIVKLGSSDFRSDRNGRTVRPFSLGSPTRDQRVLTWEGSVRANAYWVTLGSAG